MLTFPDAALTVAQQTQSEGSPFFFMVAGVFAAVVIGGQIANRRRSKGSKKMREERDALAAREGWELQPVDDIAAHVLPYLPMKSGAKNPRLLWAAHAHGTDETPDVLVCDYRYITEQHTKNGTKRVTHNEVGALMHPKFAMPAVEIARRPKIIGGIIESMRSSTVDVESAEFNQRFMVFAKDKRKAIALLRPEIQQQLLELEPWDIRSEFYRVVAHEPYSRGVGKDALCKHERLYRTVTVLANATPGWLMREITEEDTVPNWDQQQMT